MLLDREHSQLQRSLVGGGCFKTSILDRGDNSSVINIARDNNLTHSDFFDSYTRQLCKRILDGSPSATRSGHAFDAERDLVGRRGRR